VRHSSSAMADAFMASRLEGQHGQAFGTLPPETNVKEILSSLADPLA